MMIIREFETSESMQEGQRFKKEFNSYVELHLDEYRKLHPELVLEDVLYHLRLEFYKKWRSGD